MEERAAFSLCKEEFLRASWIAYKNPYHIFLKSKIVMLYLA